MRVLFTAHGAHGHIFPLVAIARALVRLGHDVTIATSRERCATVAALGLRAVPAGLDDASLVAETRRCWPETEHDPPSSWAMRMFTDIAAPAMAADLTAIVAAQRPDVIVREEGEHAGPVVAAAADLPWVTHGWGSPRPPRDAVEAVATAVAPLWQAAGLQVPAGGDLDGITVLDPCPRSLYPADAPSRANPIRPQTPALSGACDRLPAASTRPLAYVSFGTVALYQDRPQLITAVVQAVLAGGLDAVVSTPDRVLTARLTALSPERVHVERWLSLPAVLARCSIAICHGGAGTVLAALAAGIPLLLLPQGAPSQARMSNACARRGVARVIDHTFDTVTLDESLEQLTTDDRFEAAARDVAAEIEAMPGADAAATAIEALIAP